MTQTAVAPAVQPVQEGPAPRVLAPRKYFFGLLESSDKVPRRELVSMTRELATLVESGIALVPAIEMLAEQRAKKPLSAVLQAVVVDVGAGMSFAVALARHPKVFNHVYLRTLATSDHGAPLVDSLNHAAEFLESAESAVAQLKKALIYPGIVLTLGIGVSYMMLTVTLPPMIGLFQSLDTGLPIPTRILIYFSQFLTVYKMHLVIGVLAIGFAAYRYSRSQRGRFRLHSWVLQAPVISSIVLKSDIARSAGAMSALAAAGLPLADALEVAAETASNEVIKQALRRTRVRLLAGEGLAKPLADTGVFPATFTQTLRVAEDTGTLEVNLRRVAEFYRKDATEAVKTFAAILEPMSTVLIALLVGFMALAVIMPMYSILSALG